MWKPFGPHDDGSEASDAQLRLPLFTASLTDVILAVIAMYCLYLMLTRSPGTPRWMIIFYILGLVFSITDLYFHWMLDAAGYEGWTDGLRQFARAAIVAFIWVSYFRRSRRVSNTFRAKEAEVDRKLGEIFS